MNFVIANRSAVKNSEIDAESAPIFCH